MFNKILVVCVGNICRSPTGEALLKKMLPQKDIRSAGGTALVGHPSNGQAKKTHLQGGVEIHAHIPHQWA